MEARDVTQMLTLTQMAQMIAGLSTAIVNAITAGKDGATAEELAASFAGKDAALVELAASIIRAKTEGR